MVYIIIALIIIAVILILLFSLRVRIDVEMKDELKIRVWALGKKIESFPPDPIDYKVSGRTAKKIAKRKRKKQKHREQTLSLFSKTMSMLGFGKKQAKRTRLTEKEREALAAYKYSDDLPSLTDRLLLIAGVLKLFFSTLLSRLHIKTSRLKIKVGGADAAQVAMRWYGIYAACDSLIALLEEYSHFHGKRYADISIEPDYLSETTDVDVKISFSVNLFGIICILLKIVVFAATEWVDILPEQTATAKSKPQAKPNSKGKPQTQKI